MSEVSSANKKHMPPGLYERVQSCTMTQEDILYYLDAGAILGTTLVAIVKSAAVDLPGIELDATRQEYDSTECRIVSKDTKNIAMYKIIDEHGKEKIVSLCHSTNKVVVRRIIEVLSSPKRTSYVPPTQIGFDIGQAPAPKSISPKLENLLARLHAAATALVIEGKLTGREITFVGGKMPSIRVNGKPYTPSEKSRKKIPTTRNYANKVRA